MLTEEKIERMAIQMFDIWIAKVNSIKDTYCNNFYNLEEKHRLAWMELAKVLLDNQ